MSFFMQSLFALTTSKLPVRTWKEACSMAGFKFFVHCGCVNMCFRRGRGKKEQDRKDKFHRKCGVLAIIFIANSFYGSCFV